MDSCGFLGIKTLGKPEEEGFVWRPFPLHVKMKQIYRIILFTVINLIDHYV